ncbi:MAG: Rid family detoxifying hydrolase [Flavobacteriales bacterium]|nr:Rid family detoxifying hydrolase [Flavobacteriales bacterium]
MAKKIPIIPDQAPAPIGPYSPAVRFGNLLFLSGAIALDPKTGQLAQNNMEEEVTCVMRNIEAILRHAGLSWEHVLKTTIYLTHMQHFETVNRIYGSFFKDNYPARETVQVAALPRGARVEISVVAGFPE